MTLLYIVIATSAISLVAFAGALFLSLKDKFLDMILLALVAFSAGGLLGGAFLHLLPEAIGEVGESGVLKVFLSLILGFLVFFVLENFILWHHHHSKKHQEIMPASYLILVSDALHNFIDGIVIAAAFVVSGQIGVVTSLVVLLHEIPQEIGDFGIVVYGGFKKVKGLLFNFLSGVTAVAGGVVGFLLSESIGWNIVYLLPFAAGNFIYIACSDLIPEIKHKTSLKKSLVHFCFFLLGIALMLLIKE